MNFARGWLLLALVVWAPPARACVCAAPPLAEAYASADAVFVGHVAEITSKEVDGEPYGFSGQKMRELWVKFAVDEPFKGVGADPVLVEAGLADTSCTLDLVEGERYIVFAHRGAKDGTLRTGMCDLTGKVADRPETVLFVRRLVARGKGPSLMGTVWNESPTGARETLHSEQRMGGVTVVVEGKTQQFAAVTDADGIFFIDDVPPGTYTARVVPPEGFRLMERFDSEPSPDNPPPGQVVVKAGECATVGFTVTTSGSVAGRLVDASGAPRSGVQVAVIGRDDALRGRWQMWVSYVETDPEGWFRFDPMPPGEYVVGVNIFGMRELGELPYPVFFYPGVELAECAKTVTVAAGRQIDLGELKSLPPLPNVAVEVAVTDANGRGGRASVECTADGTRWRGRIDTDDEGRAKMILVKGRTYHFVATQYLGNGTLRSEQIDVTAGDDTKRLTLVAAREQ